MTRTRFAGRRTAHCLLAATMGVALAGCGGGSGNDDPFGGSGGFGDSNFDGIEDTDLDGDGIVDDVNDDGIRDFDLDGDGFLDVDLNGNGVPDVDETGGGGPTALACPGSGEDATSANDEWNDNCVLRNGVTSYYTRGVQRILYCLGYDEGIAGIGTFADAQFGNTTREAVRKFQADEGLDSDGIVGANTWAALQDSLVFVANNPTERDDSYAVAGARAGAGCGDRVQFYREYERDTATGDELLSGWKIADNPGSATRVEFSIRSPFASAIAP